MTLIRLTSWLLGLSMFLFGTLKFFQPFQGWYTTQITASGLGSFSYGLGIAGEILTGLAFLYVLVRSKQLSWPLSQRILLVASASVIAIMAVGMYVHFHPQVPAEVLPLKIKPPYIPGFFLVAALTNIVSLIRAKETYRLSGNH